MTPDPTSTEHLLTDAYTRYSADIIRFCHRHTSNQSEAEDLAQETFLRTWQYLQAGRNVENMKTFLYSVANHLIVDRFRKLNGNGHLSLDVLCEQGFDPGYEVIDSFQDKLYAQQLIASLKNEKNRQSYNLLVLRYLKGMPPSQIAGVTGMTANAVAVHLHRVIKRLTQKFLPTRN